MEMKKLFIIFVLLMPIALFAQKKAVDDVYYGSRESPSSETENLTPGQHLQRSSKYTFVGMGLMAASVIPVLLPDFEKKGDNNESYRTLNNAACGALLIVGFIYHIKGIREIGLAGNKLEVKASQNEIGLVLKF